MIQRERTADRKHPVPDFHRLRITELGYRKVSSGLDFNNGKVRVFVAADDFRRELRFIFQTDGNLGCLLDDVMIRQNEAGFVHDETGSETSDFLVAVRQVGTAKEIEEIEGIQLPRILLLVAVAPVIPAANRCFRRRFGADIDHRGIEVRRDLRKRIG